ncbi:hypothetical protein ACC717_05095 [Rhizobium ruizarguesonis]
MPQTAAVIWADGPATSPYEPAKSDIREWGTWLEGYISAFVGTGGRIYQTKTALDADLTQVASTLAWVMEDPTTANNGVYRKVGGVGTGSWVRAGDLPFSFVKLVDVGAGTANAIQVTSAIPTSSSVLRIANVFETNTGNVTLSENGGTAEPLLTNSGNQISAGGLLANMMITYIDNGTSFRLINDQVSAAIVAAAEGFATAAAASASAAAASAAAAAAAAAGVSLPAVAANRMLVDNAAGTLRESKTFPQVNDLLEKATWAFDNNTLYKSRSNKDRWLDSYRLAEELNFTGGGATATDAAVLQALYNRAKAAGRGEIILPRGDIALEAAVAIFEPGTRPLRIVGQGPNQTRFLNTAAAQHYFDIGDAAQARTNDVVIEGLQLYGAVTQNNSGRGFSVRNASDVAFKDIIIESMQNGWAFGEGASVTNDATYISIENCGCNSLVSSARAMIILGSGGILQVGGNAHRWNASGGHNFIEHTDASWNWDGMYVYGQFFEHFAKYLVSTGKGVVNAEWTGGQVDRADIAFHAEPSIAGGSNRNWNIHHVQILGFPAGGAIGALFGKGSSTDTQAVEDMKVNNCVFNGLSDAAIYAPNGEIFAYNNDIVSCAQLGASAPLGGALIRVGQGMCKIAGNIGRRALNSPGVAYRYGIQWDGATLATRVGINNDFFSFGASAETGTK